MIAISLFGSTSTDDRYSFIFRFDSMYNRFRFTISLRSYVCKIVLHYVQSLMLSEKVKLNGIIWQSHATVSVHLCAWRNQPNHKSQVPTLGSSYGTYCVICDLCVERATLYI